MCVPCVPSVCRCVPLFGALGTLLTMADGRFLAGPHAKLRAKLTEKTRTRSYKLLRKRFPAGTKELAAVPQLAASSRKVATAQQVQQYEENIRSASPSRRRHARGARQLYGVDQAVGDAVRLQNVHRDQHEGALCSGDVVRLTVLRA